MKKASTPLARIGQIIKEKRQALHLQPGRVAEMVRGWSERDVRKVEDGEEKCRTRIWLLVSHLPFDEVAKAQVVALLDEALPTRTKVPTRMPTTIYRDRYSSTA